MCDQVKWNSGPASPQSINYNQVVPWSMMGCVLVALLAHETFVWSSELDNIT